MRHSRFHNTHEGHCLPKIRLQRQEPLGHAVASGARILDISKATVETNSTTTAEGYPVSRTLGLLVAVSNHSNKIEKHTSPTPSSLSRPFSLLPNTSLLFYSRRTTLDTMSVETETKDVPKQEEDAEMEDTENEVKPKTKKYTDWPLKNIKEPHDHDVLYGRGGGESFSVCASKRTSETHHSRLVSCCRHQPSPWEQTIS